MEYNHPEQSLLHNLVKSCGPEDMIETGQEVLLVAGSPRQGTTQDHVSITKPFIVASGRLMEQVRSDFLLCNQVGIFLKQVETSGKHGQSSVQLLAFILHIASHYFCYC